jgi:hypothetical protein
MSQSETGSLLVVECEGIHSPQHPTYLLFLKASKECGDIQDHRRSYLKLIDHIVNAIIMDEHTPGDIPPTPEGVAEYTLSAFKLSTDVNKLAKGMFKVAKQVRALLPPRVQQVIFLFTRDSKAFFYVSNDGLEDRIDVCADRF